MTRKLQSCKHWTWGIRLKAIRTTRRGPVPPLLTIARRAAHWGAPKLVPPPVNHPDLIVRMTHELLIGSSWLAILQESLHWTPEAVKGFLGRVHQLGYTEIAREDLVSVNEMFEKFREDPDYNITSREWVNYMCHVWEDHWTRQAQM